jgi:CHAT domain-containing protein
MYCALVVRQGYKQPEMIPLFEEKQLAALLEKNELDDYEFISRLYKESSDSASVSNKLFRLVWQKLETQLFGVKTVYYSPSGLLHKISFGAIPSEKNLLLSDKYKLIALSSTKNILLREDSKKERKNLKTIIYGGIKYDFPKQKITPQEKIVPLTPSLRSLLPDSLMRGVSWVYLKGTLTEAQKIDSLFLQKSKNTVLFSDTSATEESFKALSGWNSPDILHIATHGFYFPEPGKAKRELSSLENIEFVKSDNPLFRSGLMFAGGNCVWKDEQTPQNREDGVLTAYELSQLYLPNTNLVVLSACETGLGQVKGSEGVFGLQRALKMAGVEHIVMSLWTVPDKQTQELMSIFYKYYLSGIELRDAFQKAQNDMKIKYKNEPFVWAAFVLIQ